MKIVLNAIENVRRIFNGMADEYDNIRDLWYQYTFGYIDKVLSDEFRHSSMSNNKPIALDIGCGTGIQSLRLAKMRYKVIGIDIADRPLGIARNKLLKHGFSDAEFLIADAQALPFEDCIADCVNCCGPTLSFIPDWHTALLKMAKCLKPNGKLLLEVEGKWNFDLFWEITNALGFNFLGYDESLLTAITHFCPPWHTGHFIDYSFKLASGRRISMPLKLFSASEIKQEMLKVGLVQDNRWGLHVLTDLIPSTILHTSNPSRFLKMVFNQLMLVEQRLNKYWPFNAFGCSLLILAHKTDRSE